MEIEKKNVLRRAVGALATIAYAIFVIALVWWFTPRGFTGGKKESLQDFPHPTIMVIAGVFLSLAMMWPVLALVLIKPISRLFYPRNPDAAETFVARHKTPRRGPYIVILVAWAVLASLAIGF
jgi:hypothetical protein